MLENKGRINKVIYRLLVLLIFFAVVTIVAQEQKKEKQGEKKSTQFLDSKSENPELIVEGVITVYAFFSKDSRETLSQIRRTTIETGRRIIFNPDGTTEEINYTRRIVRGETLEKEKIRLDQQSPTIRYSLIYNQGEIFGVLGESVFIPRTDVVEEFENQIWHSLDALLRYKENGSTISFAGRHKNLGVEYFQIDLVDKKNRKTRYFISARTFRVMWLEYEDNGVKYRRKFYDYRVVQGTLVNYRTVLLANDKQVEETNVLTVTFGQKVEEEIFQRTI